jgi:hypothetical protein
MTFTVIWQPTAQQRLAQLWMDGPNRQAISAAANAIDAALKREPLSQGESRFDSTRILVRPPLAVYYDVSKADRLVIAWVVWKSQ